MRVRTLTVFMLIFILLAVSFAGCGPISVDPDDSGAYDQGLEALAEAEYDRATDEFKKAADTDGRLAESYRGMGLVYYAKGDYRSASKLFELSLESMYVDNPEFAEDVRYYEADCLSRINEPVSAIALYETLAQGLKPYLAHAELGRVYMGQGETEKAVGYFDQAVAEEPALDIFLMIYESCREAHMEAAGAAYLEQALQISPKTAKDLADLGMIYDCLEDTPKAVEYLQKSVKSGYREAIPVLGSIYLNDKNISAARVLYEDALLNGGDAAECYNGLALCSIADGKPDAALQYIQEGLKSGNDSMKKSLLFNEVVAYEDLRDFDTARVKAQAFLELYPDDEEMKREMQFLEA